jgi:hypothetical protein
MLGNASSRQDLTVGQTLKITLSHLHMNPQSRFFEPRKRNCWQRSRLLISLRYRHASMPSRRGEVKQKSRLMPWKA